MKYNLTIEGDDPSEVIPFIRRVTLNAPTSVIVCFEPADQASEDAVMAWGEQTRKGAQGKP